MRRGLTAAGPRRPPSVRPPFFIFHRLTPAVPASSPPPGPALTPPHTQTVAYPTTQASNTRLPHDLLSGAQTNRPHTPPAAPPRAPSPTDTKKRLPAPEPPPYIRILARTIRIPPSEPAGKKHPLPATSSTSAPPGKAPEPAPTHPHPRPPAPLSDSLLTRPTQAPPLATPQRPKKRHPASRRPPPRAFPHLQVPPLPGRHKKSGSPLKAAALRSNRRAISYP